MDGLDILVPSETTKILEARDPKRKREEPIARTVRKNGVFYAKDQLSGELMLRLFVSETEFSRDAKELIKGKEFVEGSKDNVKEFTFPNSVRCVKEGAFASNISAKHTDLRAVIFN